MFWNLKTLLSIYGIIFVKIICLVEGQIPLSSIGFVETLGDKQYFIENGEKANWYKAIQICNSLDMTLASIESQAEQIQLRTFLLTNSALNEEYWLSANDLSSSGDIVWHGTGKRVSFNSWAVSPGIDRFKTCFHTDNNFNWLRDSCITQRYFICERPLLPKCGSTDTCIQKPLIIY